jgi:hypothetical protein
MTSHNYLKYWFFKKNNLYGDLYLGNSYSFYISGDVKVSDDEKKFFYEGNQVTIYFANQKIKVYLRENEPFFTKKKS